MLHQPLQRQGVCMSRKSVCLIVCAVLAGMMFAYLPAIAGGDPDGPPKPAQFKPQVDTTPDTSVTTVVVPGLRWLLFHFFFLFCVGARQWWILR